MGRCSWLVSKGKKKGEICGIYTKKKIDKKYYCASHFKMVENIDESSNDESNDESNNESEKKELPVKTVKIKENKEPKESKKVKPTLDTHKIDEVIDYEVEEIINKNKSKSELQIINEGIEYIIKRFNDIFPPEKFKSEIAYPEPMENYDVLPEIETFK